MKWIQKKNEPAKLVKWRKQTNVIEDKEIIKITDDSLKNLRLEGVDSDIVNKIESIKGKEFKGKQEFLDVLKQVLKPNEIARYNVPIYNQTNKEPKKYFKYDLTSEVKTDLKNVLLKEQGWICAYTGHEIDFEGSHIEHLKPQHYCKNGEDVDYYNLVACYPGNNTKDCTYGAIAKGNWPSPEEEDKFISPLDKSCETRFYYLYSGKIKERNDLDEAAKETIDKLSLNDDELCRHRRSVIRGIIEPLQKTSTKKVLAIKAATKALQTLRSEEGGKLKSFYFVRIQVIENFIEKLQK